MAASTMLKALCLTIVFAILLPALIVTATVALVFYVVEKEPLVRQSAPVDSGTVAAGKALLQRIVLQVESADASGTTLAVTEGELRHLAQLGSHTFARLDTDVYFDGATINSRMSLRLIPNPVGDYLNLVFQVEQSSEGINIDRLSIGPLNLPGRWLLPLIAYLADTVLQDQQASLLLASVRGFRIEGDTALLRVQPPSDVKAQFKQAVKTLQASRFPPGEQERVVQYYEYLVRLAEQGDHSGRSLSAYLTPLMVAAANRRERSSAVAENRAVIWALTIYFSYGEFETLVGDLVSSQRALVRPPSGVTLGGRRDLMAHFIYSAGITLATQQGIGIAAGEFKELLDSGNGGSGFSFADLAADRAGVQFVTTATSNEPAARRLQQGIVANNSEAAFFPDISGLAEGLSDVQFRRQYGSTQSENYRKQVALIDQRIARLPVYQGILN
ncbi:MAG: hypothetical protein DRQ97_02630 [Gammaproteobacteria bacterium]|nr:MAG: hypothetical protein DRQ97_02630 [Gammaproteobacteria bacterium]